MESIFTDLRYGLRILLKQPGFTIVAVITLALGIGANTAIFSLVNSILLRPLPFREPDRLVRMLQASPMLGLSSWGVSQADFAAYREQNRSFEAVAIYNTTAANLTGVGEPERLPIVVATADFFKVFGVNPQLGRTFAEGEDAQGKNQVCVISHAFWQRRFGGDPNVVGKTLSLNNTPTQIIGVMPAEFKFPRYETDLWTPLAHDPKRTAPYFFALIGRLKPGVQVAQAQADTTEVLQNFGRQHPNLSESIGLSQGNGPRTLVTPMREAMLGRTEKPLLVLLAAVALVLLIACANVANLLLARATSRTREIAVRVSLGASPARVARQLLTESVLLSFVGAVVGVGLAGFGIRMLDKLPISGIVRMEEVRMSGTVLAFTAGLTVLTGLLFGFMPALRAYAMGIASGIREGVRGTVSHRRLNSALVAVQFALSLVLLIGAGLLLKSFQRLQSVDLGFNPENTLTMIATLPQSKYDNEEKALRFYDTAIEKLRNSPGIKAVGLTDNLPIVDGGNVDAVIVEGQAPPEGANLSQAEQAEIQTVSPGTFTALGIPLLQGRDFQTGDHSKSQLVAIVDEPFVRRYWPGGDALGRRIQISGDRQWLTIVGIVGGVKHLNLMEEKRPHIYFAMAQYPATRASFVVRTDGPPSNAIPTFRAAIRQVDADMPLYLVRPMTDIIEETLSTQRLTNFLLTAFAIIALLLAAVGIYSTMSVYVGSRTKEFGIRLALGAQPGALRRAVMRQGLWLTGAGVVLGVVGALALTRTIRSLLFEVSVTDPTVFTVIPVLLVMVSLLACYTPARRATQVDPLVALRDE
ncbi:MAG TPA: ABC transporter permease [Pyrinomonadaceae bacterium]|nr:ABC transporter permease [Pyrinomonadaceae bacterium]